MIVITLIVEIVARLKKYSFGSRSESCLDSSAILTSFNCLNPYTALIDTMKMKRIEEEIKRIWTNLNEDFDFRLIPFRMVAGDILLKLSDFKIDRQSQASHEKSEEKSLENSHFVYRMFLNSW